MGLDLKKITAQYKLHQVKTIDVLTTSLMQEKIRTIIDAKPEADLYFRVVGKPEEFWKKSSPFTAITAVNYFVVDVEMPTFVEIVCQANGEKLNKERCQKKWSRTAAQLLGLTVAQTLITITEV